MEVGPSGVVGHPVRQLAATEQHSGPDGAKARHILTEEQSVREI